MGYKNIEDKRAASRKYYKEHPEYREEKKIYQSEWRKKNKELMRFYKYQYRDKLKRRVLSHYSDGKLCCARCEIDDIDVLCLDHINNNGAEDRKEKGISSRGGGAGVTTYAAVLKASYPEGYQVLCANCNLKKEIALKNENRKKNKYYAKK